jgi:predicted DNA-binding protein (MmcQ/YjbR family)
MHEAFADRICSGMDRAVREQPFGPDMVVWTIDGHMFAAYTEAGDGLSVRASGNVLDMVDGAQVSSGGGGAQGPLSGAGWVLIPWQTPPEELRRIIATSYDMVRADRNGHRDEA